MITGSRGFIGSALTKYFDNPIEYDIALDRRMSVLNEHALSLFMDKVEPNIIIHLAGNPFAPKSVEDPVYDMNLNVGGTLNLLEVCKNRKIDLLLFSSTAYVYGEPLYLPVDENHQRFHMGTDTPYGISKTACESYCNYYSKKCGVPITIMRFFNIYGPNQSLGLVVPDILDNIMKSKDGKVKLRGTDADSRDFLYVDDLADAISQIVKKRIVGETINLGGKGNVKIIDLAKKIAKIAGKDITFEVKKQSESSKISSLHADISKAEKLLDWSPKTSLEDGLKKVIENYKAKYKI
jgi:UDP-glucose 4-epimerase|tara:strand:+ start:4429 stop:5310 length:882 start_codon:yes stop_codon:yes gene_type:complete